MCDKKKVPAEPKYIMDLAKTFCNVDNDFLPRVKLQHDKRKHHSLK